MIIIIPSNILDIWNRLEVLLRWKLSGQTDTLTEASFLGDELYKKSETRDEQKDGKAPNKFKSSRELRVFLHIYMELPSKVFEQIAFNTRPKIEEHLLLSMNEYTHEENFSQPLQTFIKQFSIAVTFLSGYNGIFDVTNKNKKLYFEKSFTDKVGFIQETFSPGAYELESLNDEGNRTIFGEVCFTEA